MSATPKTIQIFLPGGDSRRICMAEVATHTVRGRKQNGDVVASRLVVAVVGRLN
jgi:hypothetical protein